MSAPRHQQGDAWFPPPSTLAWGWSIPAEIIDPLLGRPAVADGTPDRPVRSDDGRDAELPAG
jgi:hypothetical protein